MELDELRVLPLLAGLGDDQLASLAAAGEEVRFAPGDEVFRGGQPADVWWLLLDGTLELVRRVGSEETAVGQMGTPGQWAGGFRAWDPHGVYMATARAVTPGRMLAVPAEALGELAQSWFPFGAHLIRGLIQTARSIESTARQREALVALGTLAADHVRWPLERPPYVLETSVPGVFAAGDVRLDSMKRVASAVGEGAMAVHLVHRYLATV